MKFVNNLFSNQVQMEFMLSLVFLLCYSYTQKTSFQLQLMGKQFQILKLRLRTGIVTLDCDNLNDT